MNVVPTPRVRKIAEAMIADAEEMPGADAFMRHCTKVRRGDIPALIGLLLTATKQHKKLGRPAEPMVLSAADRMRGYALYKRGDRTEFAKTANREYQRMLRSRQRTRDLLDRSGVA